MKKRPTPAPGSPGIHPPRQRRLFRGLRTALICLILGAILNVTVAWGCALMVNVYRVPCDYTVDIRSDWHVYQWQRWGAMRIISLFEPGTCYSANFGPKPLEVIPAWGDLENHAEQIKGPEFVYMSQCVIDGRGWPMMSFWCEISQVTRTYDKNKTWITRSGTEGGIDSTLPHWKFTSTIMRPAGSHPRVLPYRPIWSGFILNTLFYAILLWLLFPGRYLLRRRRRIQRGLCGQCGYIVSVNTDDPNASPNCTECGTPIPGIVRLKI